MFSTPSSKGFGSHCAFSLTLLPLWSPTTPHLSGIILAVTTTKPSIVTTYRIVVAVIEEKPFVPSVLGIESRSNDCFIFDLRYEIFSISLFSIAYLVMMLDVLWWKRGKLCLPPLGSDDDGEAEFAVAIVMGGVRERGVVGDLREKLRRERKKKRKSSCFFILSGVDNSICSPLLEN